MVELKLPPATLPRVVATLRASARAAAVIPIAVGILVLFGWWRDIESLKRIVPGLVAMNPLTATGFLCLGFSLGLQLNKSSRIGEALGLIAALIGTIKLVALTTPFDLHIDQFLFPERLGGSDFGLPNRMAPNSALNFL